MLWHPNLPRNLHFAEFGDPWTVPMRPTKKAKQTDWAKRPIQMHAIYGSYEECGYSIYERTIKCKGSI